MTTDAIRARLAEGAPLRLGELAAAAGLSREYVRRLADAGTLRAYRPSRARAHRRVTAAEAARFLRAEGRL